MPLDQPLAMLICAPMVPGDVPPNGTSVHECDVCSGDVSVTSSMDEIIMEGRYDLLCVWCAHQVLGEYIKKIYDVDGSND